MTNELLTILSQLKIFLQCVLSSLIIVALQSVLFQVKNLPKIWKLSILDGIVFLVTYLTVVIVDIDVGLLVGLFFSILSLLIQGMKPYTCLLSRVPGTDIYVDKSKYNHVRLVYLRLIMRIIKILKIKKKNRKNWIYFKGVVLKFPNSTFFGNKNAIKDILNKILFKNRGII